MAVATPPDKTTARRQLLGERHVLQSPPLRKRVLSSLPKVNIKNIFKQTVLKSKKRMALSAGVLVLVIAGIVGGFLVYQWQNSPAAVYYRKLNTLTTQASKYVNLPQGEQPVVATVTDVTALPHESFFASAQNGDKILMYKQHKEAILFRPSTKQVITEATLDFQDTVPTPPPSVAGAATASAAIVPSGAIQSTTASQAATSPASFHPQGKILIEPQQ